MSCTPRPIIPRKGFRSQFSKRLVWPQYHSEGYGKTERTALARIELGDSRCQLRYPGSQSKEYMILFSLVLIFIFSVHFKSRYNTHTKRYVQMYPHILAQKYANLVKTFRNEETELLSQFLLYLLLFSYELLKYSPVAYCIQLSCRFPDLNIWENNVGKTCF